MSNETWWYDDEQGLVVDLTIPEGRSAALSVPVCRVLTSGVARSVTDTLGRRIAKLPQIEAEIEKLKSVMRYFRDCTIGSADIKAYIGRRPYLVGDRGRDVQEARDV